MSKQEFLDQLRVALSGQLPTYTIDEHIRYYQDYIEMELRSNRSEHDILNELGSPRLLAKSIKEASKREGRSVSNEYVEEEQSSDYNSKKFVFPKWILPVIILVVFVVILSTIFIAALPYLILIFCVVQVVRFLRKL